MTDDAFTLGVVVGVSGIVAVAFVVFMLIYLGVISGAMYHRQRVEHLTDETPAEVVQRSRRATFLLWLIYSIFSMAAYLYFASSQPTAAALVEQGLLRLLVRMLDVVIPVLETARDLLEATVNVNRTG